MKMLILVFGTLISVAATGQNIDVGTINLTLGMSKAEVFNQAAFVSTRSLEEEYKSARDLPDDKVITVFRVKSRPRRLFLCKSPRLQCRRGIFPLAIELRIKVCLLG